MKRATKRALTWIISLGLTVVLLYFFLHKANFSDVARETENASLSFLGLAVLLEVVSIVIRAYRWGVMLRSVKKGIPMAPLLKATVVSFTMTGLIPGRLGEVGKPYLLSVWQKLPFGSLLASVVLERGMDLVALVVLWFGFVFFGSSGIAPGADEAMKIFTDLSWGFLALAVIGGIFLFWLVPRRRVLDRMARRSDKLSRYPLLLKLVRKVLKFVEGLGTFQKKRTILWVTFLSVIIWTCIAGSAWALLKALKLHLPLGASVLLLMFVCFGAAIPTPGGVGGVHKAIQIALVMFYSVGAETAVTAGILGHATMFFPGILWGLGYLALGRVHIRELREVARASSEKSDQMAESSEKASG